MVENARQKRTIRVRKPPGVLGAGAGLKYLNQVFWVRIAGKLVLQYGYPLALFFTGPTPNIGIVFQLPEGFSVGGTPQLCRAVYTV